MQRVSFQRVAPGDPISAADYNRLLEAVEMLSGLVITGGSMLWGPNGPVFVPAEQHPVAFVELDSDVEMQHAASANELQFDDAIASGSDPWEDSSINEDFVCAPYPTVALTGERTMLFSHSVAGRNVIFPFTAWHIAKLTDDLSAGSTSTADIWEVQASGHGDSDKNVTVYDWLLPSGETITSGSEVIVAQHRQSRRWYVVSWAFDPDDVKEGVLDGDLLAATGAKTGPSTATLSVYTNDASGVHDSGDDITVTQRFTEVGTVSAGTWMVARKINGEWRPITTDCAPTTL